MMLWEVHTPEENYKFHAWLAGMEPPFTASVTKGVKRTNAQNKTIHMWFEEIANHRGDTTKEEVKAECNLRFGGPILTRDDPDWQEQFDSILRPLGYRMALRAIEVFDIPFTRRMQVKQLTEYMDAMQKEFLPLGIRLTDPNAKQE